MRLSRSRRASLDTTDLIGSPPASWQQLRPWPSPAPFLERLLDCGHFELHAAVNLLAVRRDEDDPQYERLFEDRQQAVFQPFQTPRDILADHCRALASSAALRSRMRCTPARIVSPMDMPGRYTGSGSSSGSGKPSLAARRRWMSRTISWRRRDSSVSAGGSNPSSSRRSRLSSTRIQLILAFMPLPPFLASLCLTKRMRTAVATDRRTVTKSPPYSLAKVLPRPKESRLPNMMTFRQALHACNRRHSVRTLPNELNFSGS